MSKKRKTARADQFFNRMAQLIGETEARQLMEAVRLISPKSIRYNRRLCSTDDLKGKPVPWCVPYGCYWEGETLPSRTLEYAAGKYYIQEAAAMLAISAASEVIDFSDKIVLDLTAAPGGKATQVAELIRTGYLAANETVRKRVNALTWNINRHRLNNVIITSMSTASLAGALPGFFDVVVVDAPCSGEGLFQRQKHSLENWSEKNVRFCARRQESILEDAAVLVRPGGWIVYATCTFAPEENEAQVEKLLKMGFSPVPLPGDLPVSSAVSTDENVRLCSRRIFPHRENGAGAFVSVLRKEESISCSASPPSVSFDYRYGQPSPAGMKREDFPYIQLEDTSGYFYEKNGVVGYFSFERLPEFLLQAAFQVGASVLHKHRPHECMFGSIQLASPGAVVEVEEENAWAYIRGEDLRLDCPDGYHIISCRGMRLGHVFVSGGNALNKLPNALKAPAAHFLTDKTF
jgi:16S rRNA C967 or C1407 C5-methylase (RsmB/RsmF family)